MSLSQMVKSYWIKAKLQVTKLDQRFYFLACPNCSKPCGASYGDEFKCLYCGNDFPTPKAVSHFEVDLCDGTTTITAFAEQEEATTLLGMSAEEVIEEIEKKKKFNPNLINEKFKDDQLFFHIKT